MRVLYLTPHLSDVDVAQRELDKMARGIVLEPSAGISDVVAVLERGESIDAVVVDAVGTAHAASAISELRVRFDVAIVALVRPGQPDSSTEVLLAGADEALPRRPGATDALVDALETAMRRSPSRTAAPEPVRLGWVGDVPSARRALSASAHLALEPLPCDAATGEPTLPRQTSAWPDAFVLDETIGGVQVFHAVEALARRGGGRPVFVVTGAGAAREAAYRRRGAEAAIAPASLPDLVRLVEQAVARERAEREVEGLRTRELRLRTVVETLPQGVLRIARDGSLLAVNLAGLAAFGAERPQQVVGKNLVALAEPASRSAIATMLAAVCAGEPSISTLTVTGVDDVGRRIELRGTPLRRDGQGTEVLAAIGVVPVVDDQPSAQGGDLPSAAQSALHAMRAEVEEAISPAAEASPDVETWRARVDALTEEIDERRAIAEEAAESQRVAEQEVVRLAVEVAAERERWQEVRAALEQRAHDLEEQQAQQAVDAARRAMRLQQIEEEQRAEVAALRDALDAAGAAASFEVFASGQQELDEARARAGQLAAALDEARTETSALADALDQLRADAEAGRRREEDAAARVATVEAAMAEQRREAEYQAQGLREEADGVRARFEAAAAESGARVRHLLSELERERTALASAQQEAEQLRDGLRELEGTVASLAAARAAAETRARELSETQHQLEEAYQRTLSDVERFRGDATGAVARAEAMAGFRDELRARVATLEHDLGETRQQVEATAGERDAATRALAEAHDEVGRRQAALEAATEARTALNEALQAERARVATLEHDLGETRQQVEATAGERDAATRALAEAHDELGRRQAALGAATEGRTALNEALQAERARVATLGSETDAAHRARNEALEELGRVRAALEQSFVRRAEVEQTLQVEQGRVTSLTGEVEASQQARNAALEELGRVRSLFDTTAARLSGLEADLERERARQSEHAAEIVSVTAARDGLVPEVERLHALITPLEARRNELEAEARRLTDRHEGLSSDHDRLRESFAEVQRQWDQARQRLVEAEGERETLRHALRQAEAAAALASARQAEERSLVERALDEARTRLASVDYDHRAAQEALERRLRQAEEREALLLASAPFGLATATSQGALISCNAPFARWCGASSAADLMARQPAQLPVSLVVPPPNGATDTGAPHVEVCVEQPDGRLVWLEGVATQVTSETTAPTWRWTFADVTDRHLRLRQARQMRRLEALGSLASSASHDLGTLMSGVREAIDALAASGGPEAVTAAARASVAKAIALAHQLAAYAQKQARPVQLVDLARLTADLAPTLRRLMGADITLETDTTRSAHLSADPDEIEQVLAALALAGRDALPVGGTVAIGITTRLVPPSGGQPMQRVGVLTCTATGFGVRPSTPATSASEAVAQQGGHLRVDHVAGRSVVFEAVWPLVQTVTAGPRGSDAHY